MAAKTIKKPTRSIKTVKKVEAPIEKSSYNPQGIVQQYATKKNLVVIAVALAVVFLFYTFKGLFIAATVNGQIISRLSVIKALEAQGGKRIVESIVTQTLIQQEAKKKNITIDEKIIDEELISTEKQLVEQGQNITDWLVFQGLTKETFREQIRLNKSVEELLKKDIAVTDAEIADFTEKNQEVLAQQIGSDSAKIATAVKNQLKSQKLNEKGQPWLAELQKNAKVNYFVNY